MRTLAKIALTATLALTASFGIVEVGTVRAEVGQSLDRNASHNPADAVQTVARSEPLDGFSPEPNDPPVLTGGSGTR